ncbi:MAG: kelch repeat-containing protein [Lacunisphaera sp.]|nr:kelch repeat-containing protein [Lacunisphaera sp.]
MKKPSFGLLPLPSLPCFRAALLLLLSPLVALANTWEPLPTHGQMHPRHEAAFIAVGDKIYLLGGRRLQPVDILDPATGAWSQGAPPPVEVHHFQPVVWENRIWLVGAMTGGYPHERALDHIPVYDPATDTWSRGPSLPEQRRRGGAGAVIREGKLYVVCGIINGHWDGHVAWLDELNLATGAWRELPDAPRARDHFQAAIVSDKLYAAGGRRSWAARKETFTHVEPLVDAYHFKTGAWSTLPSPAGDLPAPRAGSMSIAIGRHLIVAGGESLAQTAAHAEVHVLDTATGTWSAWPAFARGRHGSGLARLGDRLYIASGSGNRGGAPELDSVEVLDIATLPVGK